MEDVKEMLLKIKNGRRALKKVYDILHYPKVYLPYIITQNKKEA